jgi:hypothetical protein
MKTIKGFKNYKISRYGKVINKTTHRVMKPHTNNKGRIQIFMVNNKGKKKGVIRAKLVALSFVPNDNPKEKTQVNHKDGIKTNDYYKNLEWTTPSENIQHAFDNGLMKPQNLGRFGSNSTHHRSISEIDTNGKVIKTWGSIVEACEELGAYRSSIEKVLRGARKTWKNRKFKRNN